LDVTVITLPKNVTKQTSQDLSIFWAPPNQNFWLRQWLHPTSLLLFKGTLQEKERALTLICQLSFVNKRSVLGDESIKAYLDVMASDENNQ